MHVFSSKFTSLSTCCSYSVNCFILKFGLDIVFVSCYLDFSINRRDVMDKQVIFFSYLLGEYSSHFARNLQKKGFELVVANCDDSHSCFNKTGIKHTFRNDADNAPMLDQLYYESTAKKLECTVLVIDCDSSLATSGFEANRELRCKCVYFYFVVIYIKFYRFQAYRIPL